MVLTETERRALKRARNILAKQFLTTSCLESPTATREYLTYRVGHLDREAFGCLFLSTRHQVIEAEELFFGSIDSATVHPRVVVKRALELNAAAVILYHNHPSGVGEPSQADQAITKRLVDALRLLDIRVLDHIVISYSETISMAERGLL